MSTQIIDAIREFDAAHAAYVEAGIWYAGLRRGDRPGRIDPMFYVETTTNRHVDAIRRLVSLLRRAGIGGFKHAGRFYIDARIAPFEADDYGEMKILVIDAEDMGRAPRDHAGHSA